MSEDIIGFNCTTCGKRHEFSMYVYAHWNEPLTHTCDACGAQHDIQRGIALLRLAGKTEPA